MGKIKLDSLLHTRMQKKNYKSNQRKQTKYLCDFNNCTDFKARSKKSQL